MSRASTRRVRPASCGHQRSSISSFPWTKLPPRERSASVRRSDSGAAYELNRVSTADANAVMASAKGTKLHGERNMSPRLSSIAKPRRCHGYHHEVWMEAWISSALRARRRDIEKEALPGGEGENHYYSDPAVEVDGDHCIMSNGGLSWTKHVRSFLQVARAGGSKTADKRSKCSRSAVRPSTATGHREYHHHLRTPGRAETRAPPRPASASVDATRPRWTGPTAIKYSNRKCGNGRQHPCRPSLVGKGISQQSQMMSKGKRQRSTDSCCRRQIEPTWSYEGYQGSRGYIPIRRILVKIPRVKNNTGETKTGVPYRMVWNGGIAGESGGDPRSCKQLCDATYINSTGTDTAVVSSQSAVAKSLRPMEQKGAPFISINGSVEESPPQPRAGEGPRTSRVITQLRASELRSRGSSARDTAGPSTTSRLLTYPYDDRSRREAGAIHSPKSDARPQSALTGTRVSLFHSVSSTCSSTLQQTSDCDHGWKLTSRARGARRKATPEIAAVDCESRRPRCDPQVQKMDYYFFPSAESVDRREGNAVAPFSARASRGRLLFDQPTGLESMPREVMGL